MKRERGWFSGLSMIILAAVMAILPLSGCRKDPGPDLIGKVLSAYGGEKALRHVRSVVYRGEIDATMRRDRGKEVICFERPGRLRVSLAYSRSREERVLNGSRGWRNSGEGFREVKGPPLEAMVFQYRHLDLPLGLVKGGYRISLSEEKRNGKSFPVLNLKSPEGPPMIVTVDPDTGLILHVAGIFRVEGGTTRLEVDYGDYRPVAGVMLPHRIVNYAGGMEIARTVFDQVEVNKPLDPRIFSPVEIPAIKD
jgi:hypothetical protein